MARKMIITCMLAATALASCNRSEYEAILDGLEPIGEETANLVPLAADLEIRLAPAATPFYWSNGMRVSLFGRAEDVSDTVNDNLSATYMNGLWDVSQPIRVGLENMDIYAAYPYREGAAADRMPLTPLMYDAALVGRTTAPVNMFSGTATIYMSSPLATVTFRFRKAEDVYTECTVTGVRLTGNGIELPVEGYVSLYDGTVVPTGWGEYDISARDEGLRKPVTIGEKYGQEGFSFQTMPMMVTDGAHALAGITVTINGKEYAVLPRGVEETTYWEGGTSNVVYIYFDGSKAVIEGVGINGWVDRPMEAGW